VRLPVDPFLPPVARRLLAGADADLLRPLRLVLPGWVPPPAAPRDGVADRAEVAAALRARNAAFGHPRAAELAAELARPDTLVVATGQQPGLFGGPLYTLVKAVAAVLWAEALAAASGRAAVPVFWIAGDDHDFAEIGKAFLPAAGEAVEPWVRLDDAERELEPVGPRPVGDEPRRELETRRAAAAGERYRRWLARLGDIYAPGASFTEAFARVLVELLGERCPLLLDPADEVVRRRQARVLARILARAAELERALEARERELVARGLAPRVAPQPGCPPVFVLEQGRRLRLRRCAGATDDYELRGGSLRLSLPELERLLEQAPERFSPSVLSRPLVQDELLATDLFLVGPGELSYLAQAAALYEPAGVAPPAVALRPQALVLDPRRLRNVETLAARGLPLGDLLGDDDSFEGALASLVAAEDPLAPPLAAVTAAVDELERAALAIDAQLAAPLEKTREQIDRALGVLGAKVRASLARVDQDLRRRALAVRDWLRPAGALQERVLCSAHAAGLYGEALGPALRRGLDLDPRWLQLLVVGDAEDAAPTSEGALQGARAAAGEEPA
jgi:bacillithiol biosynthesis cysteine-adding enzyme BshC